VAGNARTAAEVHHGGLSLVLFTSRTNHMSTLCAPDIFGAWKRFIGTSSLGNSISGMGDKWQLGRPMCTYPTSTYYYPPP
jgi:hypothetical protein